MDNSAYGVLLVSGFLGSLGHCLGMCGPLVLMVGVQMRVAGVSGVPYHLLYHGARVAVYTLLGALVGGIGSLLGLGSQLNRAASVVSLALGMGVIALGAGYLGWLPLSRLEGSGEWASRTMSGALRRGGVAGMLLLGALNGLLPCGLVYSALLVAASTGGPLPGAVGMFLFGVGTLPALLVVAVGAGMLSARVRQTLTRLAGALIVVVGLQLALRGLAGLGLLPHLQMGEWVIW
jgi:sulfite exporter TauE/SafE